VKEQAMPQFMDFHPNSKLPAQAIAQIADPRLRSMLLVSRP
jgi:hypothetical protein